MQVRDGRTRGLDLHLARLDAAHRDIYGKSLDGNLVRARIRHALDGQPDASVRVSGSALRPLGQRRVGEQQRALGEELQVTEHVLPREIVDGDGPLRPEAFTTVTSTG